MTHDVRSFWRRRRFWIPVGVFLLLWGLFAAWLLGTAWYEVPRYQPSDRPSAVSRIMTSDQYAQVVDTHPRPYVYQRSIAPGAVLIFGATHTKNPDDNQFATMRRRWNDFRPTLLLVESDLGMLFPAFMDPVTTFGEVGFAHALAREHHVETLSWEPTDETLLLSVIEQGFSKEAVALRWVLTPYFSNLRHGRPDHPERLVQDTLGDKANVAPIRGTITSIDDVRSQWTRLFPDGPAWQDVSDEFGLPGELGDMDFNKARDEHLVACLAEFVGKGERVFVVSGSSHAVKIEPAVLALEAMDR